MFGALHDDIHYYCSSQRGLLLLLLSRAKGQRVLQHRLLHEAIGKGLAVCQAPGQGSADACAGTRHRGAPWWHGQAIQVKLRLLMLVLYT